MIDPSIPVSLAAGAALVAVGPVLAARAAEPPGRLALAASAFHPLLFLGLFYSLALHMHRRLDGWPRRIGFGDWPEGLVVHAKVAQVSFGALLLGGLFVWPVAVFVCACVPGLRPGLRALGVYALVSVAAVALMQLAPEPFLYWWWD